MTASVISPDALSSLDWQRSNAGKIKSLLQYQADWIDENYTQFMKAFQTDFFDITTANEFGLSVWAIILNENVFGVTKASGADFPAWGFGENRENFSNGAFGSNSDSGYNFTEDEARILLLLKAYICHMSGSVYEINQALYRIFGGKKIVCIDNRDMTFTYIIYASEYVSLAYELYNRDLLPRPIGINISLIIDDSDGVESFGFGDENENFGNGNFYNGVLING